MVAASKTDLANPADRPLLVNQSKNVHKGEAFDALTVEGSGNSMTTVRSSCSTNASLTLHRNTVHFCDAI